ncbi:sn-glycerol-3-phosphate ABC transporter ATP-binding protein UgpC [Sansalvadorimonas sp. 2012CJ34-2]|uniref:Sn-glycerol-3-phosphate ABC transporter ATP-binding protein UgpC n=1 Tax=Parendozoicomonas callyspongiae TaxID=2942213 RepID=A0ABT0PHH4_9GAMM|nr:sn-glycerol-3-phosphate ABC transporter ATP-binding protein UgpC [Sansalvadorimonas sp. 2012CJ34-2]MCL6270788.1 sn-glycerol-3-phosphate ABC transporter ATP-binding protein UgpC [Sansalvadorimonas sp. 2012CJ34-2]
MAELILKNVVKDFGKTRVIHGVDLHIHDQELVVFVGPSGCGKSTLLRLIAGLEDISDGELFIDGELVNSRSPKQRGIAMVFQSYALYPHMTVYQNMAFGLELSKFSKAEIKNKVLEAARILELSELLDRLPKQLSGGQRQRVAIGRAIVRDPRVFLFDEPLSNLDAALRVQMRIEFAKLHREMNATMIYVTHDQVEAMTLASRIVVLSAGRVEQVGSPLELYHHPRNLFVAEFIGSPKMNILPAEVVNITDQSIEVSLEEGTWLKATVDSDSLTVGDRVSFGVRPEHMWISEIGDLKGTVEVIEQLGENHYLHVRLADNRLITVQGHGDATLKHGERCCIAIPPECAHIFNGDGLALQRLQTGADEQPIIVERVVEMEPA